MTTDPQHPGAGARKGPTAIVEERLEAIETALRRFLAAEADPPPQAVDDVLCQLAELSGAIARMPPEAAAACIERAGRIRRLHDQLALRLTQQRHETASQLAHIREGKRTLKAYGGNV
jgi:hypothetical protein